MLPESYSVHVPRRRFLKVLPQVILDVVRDAASHALDQQKSRLRTDSSGRLCGKPSVARLDVTRCLAWEGAPCQMCYLACPERERAIRMEDQKPVIVASACTGCAACEIACQTVNDQVAITMVVIKRAKAEVMKP